MIELATVEQFRNPSEEIRMDEQKSDLIPKAPPKLAPQGIRSFTVTRQRDETGISGTGIVIEGTVHATGQCMVHWLYPPPRGSFAIFDSLDDFLKVHVKPHLGNETIITFNDGEQRVFHKKGNEDIETVTNVLTPEETAGE